MKGRWREREGGIVKPGLGLVSDPVAVPPAGGTAAAGYRLPPLAAAAGYHLPSAADAAAEAAAASDP